MWLPAFKYIKGLLALRGQFMLPSGEPYEGPYHELYNGETYTGSAPNVNAIRIYADDSEPHLPEPTYEEKLVTESVFPSPEDYDKGFFLRYYVKDNRNGKIIEVKKTTYKEKLKEKYLSGTSIKWILDKPVKDIFNQGYLYKGAITRNKENVKKGSLEIKGLDTFITEYDKFVNIESDLEGYKFEELPRNEKIRIIKKISNFQKTPKKAPKPRFKKKLKKKLIPIDDLGNTQTSTNPTSGGSSSGGGGGYNETYTSIDDAMDGGPTNNNFNNYY